jgi:hypothetical protein
MLSFERMFAVVVPRRGDASAARRRAFATLQLIAAVISVQLVPAARRATVSAGRAGRARARGTPRRRLYEAAMAAWAARPPARLVASQTAIGSWCGMRHLGRNPALRL